MNKKKIIVSVTNDLVTDNRVHKVCETLRKNDYNILLVGRKLKSNFKIKRKYKTKRLKLIFKKSALFYIEYNIRLFLFLLFKKADAYLSNDLDTLLANFLASKIKRKKLIYDSHELFTEVPELINRKKIQKIWLFIEKKTYPKIKYSYTVCNSIANYYKKKYGIEMQVVKNVPICNPKKIQKPYNEKKIIIYQGAININRGLEETIEAMKYLENTEFWIIGTGDIFDKINILVEKMNLTSKVKILGRKKTEELPKYTLKADLGISLEKNKGLNYYFALPNKIFDYIQSETPVLCSDLPEMKKIIENYKIGEVLISHKPEKIANQIKKILKDYNKIQEWRKNLKEAKKILCWKNEENKIIQIFNSAFQK